MTSRQEAPTPHNPPAVNAAEHARHHRIQSFRYNANLFLLSLPAVLFFFVFCYIPMFGVIIAFKEYRYDAGILGSKFIWFENFRFFFTSQDAWRLTRNTVGYAAAFIVTGTFLSIAAALLLFELKSRRMVKIYQTAMILPRFLSWVIVGFITYIVFQPDVGIMDQIMAALGVPQISWYAEKRYWPFILVVVNLWKGIGMSSVMYYAVLVGVDESLFEAAEIDGASKLQKTWNVSLPALVPLTVILLILSIGGLFRGDFGLFYQIPRDVGTLYPATDIIDTYVYRGLRGGNIAVTAAVGLFQSIVGFVLIVAANAVVRRVSAENSLF
jgi:putative aldouronate transport system permease protein